MPPPVTPLTTQQTPPTTGGVPPIETLKAPSFTTASFANSIRQKFPTGKATDGRAYTDIPDDELTNLVTAKYPTYKTQISDYHASDTSSQQDTISPAETSTTPPKSTLGDLDAEQLKQSAEKVIDSIKEAGTNLSNDADGTFLGEAKGVKDVLEGVLGSGAGIVQGVGAAPTAIFQWLLQHDPVAATPETPDPADPTGKIAAASKAFSTAHPELSKNLRDAVILGGAVVGGPEGIFPAVGDMTLGDFASTGKGMLDEAVARVKAGAGAVKEAVAPTTPVVETPAQPVIPAPKTPTKAGNVARSAVSALTGMQPSTISEVMKNPDLYTHENITNATRQSLVEEVQKGIADKVRSLETIKDVKEVSPRALAEQIGDALKNRETELEQNARNYGEITGERTPGSTEGPTIKVAKNWLDTQIQKTTGRAVKNGRIDTSASSAAALREPRDISKAQTFLDTHRPAFQKGTLSGNEFLNIRDDLTKLSNFDNGGAPSAPLEKIGKSLRANLNDSYRHRFSGLEQADATYEKNVTDLNRLKVGLIDDQGNLSENAINRIVNSTKKGQNFVADKLDELVPGIRAKVLQLKDLENEQARARNGIVDERGHLLDGAANRIANAGGVGKDLLSSRLEEIAPGINNKVRFMKAVEDIRSAGGLKTASYTRNIIGGAGIATAFSNPSLIALWALSHPDVAVPMLRKLGASAPQAEKIVTDLGVIQKK